MKIDEIEFDEEIYPREQISHKIVESYVEALYGGATFPPIEMQCIMYEDDTERMICLDGRHRILAIEEFNRRIKQQKIEDEEETREPQPILEIDASVWKDEVLDRKDNLEDLQIRSAVLNLKHGYRLRSSDLASVVLKIIKARPIERLNGVINELAHSFHRNPSSISWLETEEGKITDILSKIRLSRDVKIWRLLQLGWTQQEVGNVFGMTQVHAGEIKENFKSKIISIQHQSFKDHKSIEEIARFNHLDELTAWAMILQGKDDLERFGLFGDSKYSSGTPRIYNVWNFMQRDPRLGDKWAGNIPGQIAMNILYYYTKQGDLVIDPMAGGGSTIDVCLVMGRKCRAYDIETKRKDIIKHDIREGFSEKAKKCDLIFLDPPYWRLQRGKYIEKSVSEGVLKDWKDFMRKLAKDSYTTLKAGGHLALVIEAFLDEKVTGEFLDLPFECTNYFLDNGFEEAQRIAIPMPSEIKSVQDVEYAKEKKIMLDLNRDLIIFRKV